MKQILENAAMMVGIAVGMSIETIAQNVYVWEMATFLSLDYLKIMIVIWTCIGLFKFPLDNTFSLTNSLLTYIPILITHAGNS